MSTPSVTSTQRWSMLAAILGSAIVFLDGTIVNVGLAKIGDQLPATIVGRLEGLTYVTSGYYATLAALLVLAGALADYYGRRRIFASGWPGSARRRCCAASRRRSRSSSSPGCSRAPPARCSSRARIAIITALFEGPARARAFGIWAAATSATSPIGTLVGGTLIDTVGWRAAFLINVPIIAIALYATLRHMPETRAEQASARFDWLGSLVAILAVGGLAFGVIRGQDQQWRDPIGVRRDRHRPRRAGRVPGADGAALAPAGAARACSGTAGSR